MSMIATTNLKPVAQSESGGAPGLMNASQDSTGGGFDLILNLALSLGALKQNPRNGSTGKQVPASIMPGRAASAALDGQSDGNPGLSELPQSLTTAALMASPPQTSTKESKRSPARKGDASPPAKATSNTIAAPVNQAGSLAALAATAAGLSKASSAAETTAAQIQPAIETWPANAANQSQAAEQTPPAATDKAWNIHELGYQLSAALSSLSNSRSGSPALSGYAPDLSASSTTTGNAQPSEAGASGTNLLPTEDQPASLESMAQTQADPLARILSGTTDASLAPAGTKPGLKPEAKESPEDLASLTVQAAAKGLALNKPPTLEWSAQPVQDSTGGSRQPSLIEQVRQISQFIADRSDGVIRLGQNGMDANLKLYPPDLGNVRVELSVQNNHTAQAQFIVERPETAQLLQQHLQSFQDGLSRQGLTVDRVRITVQPLQTTSSSPDSTQGQNEMGNRARDGSKPFQKGNDPQTKRDAQAWEDPEES
jgi:flagellar hook-length control protein FliK